MSLWLYYQLKHLGIGVTFKWNIPVLGVLLKPTAPLSNVALRHRWVPQQSSPNWIPNEEILANNEWISPHMKILLGKITPPKFNSSPLKNGGWKTIPSYREGNFSGAVLNFGGVFFLPESLKWKIAHLETSHTSSRTPFSTKPSLWEEEYAGQQLCCCYSTRYPSSYRKRVRISICKLA